jgi:hypothetical protein
MRLSCRRWWLWSAVTLVMLIAAAVYLSWSLSHRERVTDGNLAKLKLGMRESEVRKILGDEGVRIPCASETRWRRAANASWYAEEWKGRTVEIRILFDSEDQLRDWTATATGKFEFSDRLLKWLNWLGL